ncbi:protein kinase [Cystobacter fuscus]|uniref:nSTAND1 domain-containing NTPase n=1 Tax=Cystobacter fuscus TaxID=43 RepID=UPI0037C060A8
MPGLAPKATAEASAHGPSWTPPAEFGEFRLERLLGRGGMGVVYLAQDTSLGRPVAVKFIASREPGPTVLAYFETEARAIARLQHPNVVSVFRVGEVDGHPYIVSEYVSGTSLARLPLPLPWRRVLSLGLGLARGLASAHHRGVLHRDVKPANAMLTDEGVVKLLDFGLAERFGASEAPRPADAPPLLGTPPYMAPELWRGLPGTPQSDVYALGVTLYALCMGGPPPRPRPEEPPGAAAPEPWPPPIGPESGIDPDFAALIMRCLAPDPAHRFAAAGLLCEALERLEQLHTPAPLAAGNPYRGLAPFEAEHRALFFGRDADIRAVLERLRRQPLVLVAGDSGVGKSSLCRAGVLPRVAAGALDERGEVVTVTLWPGRQPLEALAAALAPLLGCQEPELVTALTDSPPWLGQALRAAYAGRRGLLLFVDQLEELITLAEPAQAARFAALLGELALPSEGVRVLMAVRGDFLTRVSALPGLGQEAERALYILRPLLPEGLREAIVGPARSQGVSFESEAMVGALTASMEDGAGTLPLLQFALAELWERRDPARGRITLAALGEMGGVAGALSRHGDEVLQRLGSAEQPAARRLLLRLVTAEGTRHQRTEEELTSGADTSSRTALQALLDGRLLHAHTEGSQTRYELVHDSLIVSWGTLRNLLDDSIGHRAALQRVEAASAEWERLERAREALWGQRQLDEVRLLEPASLGHREQAFLAASRRASRRQRWGLPLAALFVVLCLAALYGGLRLRAYLEDERFVAGQLATARELSASSRSLGERARLRREEALVLFDGRAPGVENPWSAANQHWADALALFDEANEAAASASQSLERALERTHDRAEALRQLTELTYARLLLAEEFHRRSERRELQERLERLIEKMEDGAPWRERLSAPAELELVTEPPGARVELERYLPNPHGAWRREPLPELGLTPVAGARLPEGSYLLHITQPDRAPVTLPLLLTRGSREQLRLVLPATVPEGYVYIPPGCSLLGTDAPELVRRFLFSSPLHRVCFNEGYVIGRTEVTFGDWLVYLDSLPLGAPARHFLEKTNFTRAFGVSLRHQADTGWTYSFHRSNGDVLTARERETFHHLARTQRKSSDWRRFPLAGASANDLADYFSWLNSSGRLPGARLCTEHEWERAARGADGRAYPHGDQLMPDEANIDATYGRQASAYGPDEVGSFPASTSPFGLADMAGNVLELAQPVTPELGSVVLRGGGWYYDDFGALAANRASGEPTERDVRIGVRVCAPFPDNR